MPVGRSPAWRAAACSALDHVAACGDEHDACARPVRRVDDAERLVLEHRLVERHRDVVLRMEAHGRRDLLGVGQRRQVDRPHRRSAGWRRPSARACRACARGTARAAPRRAPRRRRPRRRAARPAPARRPRHARLRWQPSVRTWTAAAKPGSMSRPTTVLPAGRDGAIGDEGAVGRSGASSPRHRPEDGRSRGLGAACGRRMPPRTSRRARAREQRDDPAEREEGAERHRRLSPLRHAPARHDRRGRRSSRRAPRRAAPRPPSGRGTGRARRRA